MAQPRATTKLQFLFWALLLFSGNSFATARLSVLNVGYGSCILLQTPTQNFLFDTGPKERSSKVLNFLADQKVGWLTAVFISHEHPDHTGALLKIMEQIPVNMLFWPDSTPVPEAVKKMVENNSSYQTQVKILEHGIDLKPEPDLRIRAMPSHFPTEDSNDDAIVFGLVYKKQKILIAGDIGWNRQDDLGRIESEWLQDVGLLLWPHHGDKISPAFKKLFLKKPYCVISVGENPLGLPDPAIEAESRSFCRGLYRTDAMSDITFQINRKILPESTDSRR